VRSDGLVCVVTVAGSDPTGGAGVQGDLKTFAAHGVYGAAVVAALTVQNHAGVTEVLGVEPRLVVSQLQAVLDQVAPAAAKTGMLYRAETVERLADLLRRRPLPNLVVDPVLSATSGGSLAEPGLREALVARLLPLATVVTPNLPEAEALLGRPVPPDGAEDAARALLALGCRAVLVKGGHAPGPATDVLATGSSVSRWTSPRVDTPHGHGAGCALAASIAARLAKGDPLERAVEGAREYVHRAIEAAVPLGRGRGPVRHDVES
jgi:hydroxymethylpyrimidine/phosphomethylpyrimidine kinase